MKDIVLIDLKLGDYGTQYDKILPLGMCYLTGALRDKTDYSVHAFHVSMEDMDTVLSFISTKNPLFIGFCSTMSGTKILPLLRFSRAIKKIFPDIPIVWGGALPTALPELCLKELCVDIVCIGDGEDCVVELAQALNGQIALETVRGLAYRLKDDDEVFFTEKRPLIVNIDDYFPDFSFIDFDQYVLDHKGQGMLKMGFCLSRGCPFECGFCYNSSLEMEFRRWRVHSTEYCEKLIDIIKSHCDIGYTSFVDDNVGLRKDHLFKILEIFTSKGIIPIHFQMRMSHLKEEDVIRLGKYPIERITFGLESSLPRIQKLMKKNLNLQQIRKVIDYFDQHTDFELRTNIIGCLPTETRGEMMKDLKKTFTLSRWNSNLRVEYQLFMPYPKTNLTGLAIQDGFQEPETLEEWSQQNHIAAWFEPKPWLSWQKEKDQARFYLIKKYISLVLYYNIDKNRKGIFWNILRQLCKLKFHMARWCVLHNFFPCMRLQHMLLDFAANIYKRPLIYEGVKTKLHQTGVHE